MWLERSGPPHANDAMVLERLAHSVTVSRPGAADAAGQQALEVLLDAGAAASEQERAAARLGLEARTLLTVVALGRSTPSTGPATSALASARMATAYGLVMAVLVRGDLVDDLDPVADPASASATVSSRCGPGWGSPSRSSDCPSHGPVRCSRCA